MRISLIVIGKTSAPWLREGIQEYVGRLARYAPFRYVELPDAKLRSSKPSPDQLKAAEAPILIKALADADHVVLLDEHGKQPRSVELAKWMEDRHHRGIRHLALVIGGAYGFAPDVKAKANEKLALSSLTFSHQMIRLLAVEQLYRAQTILRGEPYHHE
ncbi:23S rRNA (pseudouridine(1915)-N(3))-methyltransferase RlmH [Flavobacteriales bacterium]|nr:23S rRNA (pseudouridine(1915)-N(3))-methyltransferase RlmH [Flavobacteriales bacterium]